MRRGKRIEVVEFPIVDPEHVVYEVPLVIPVELPQPYEPAVPNLPVEPKKKAMEIK
jgi:hypothetical protein